MPEASIHEDSYSGFPEQDVHSSPGVAQNAHICLEREAQPIERLLQRTLGFGVPLSGRPHAVVGSI